MRRCRSSSWLSHRHIVSCPDRCYARAVVCSLSLAERHRHNKRSNVYVVEQVDIFEVIYVDDAGQIVGSDTSSVVTEITVSGTDVPTPAAPQLPQITLPAAQAPKSTTAQPPPPPPPSSSPPPPPSPPPPAPQPAATPPPTNSQPKTQAAASYGSGGLGITYAPYDNSGGCKTSDQIKADFDKIQGYNKVRIYGTDCNQVANIVPIAAAKGFTLFLGVFDIGNVAGSVKQIIDGVGGSWQSVDAISVGNELVNSGQASVSTVVAAIGAARTQLRAAGYNGPVVTVDTFNAVISNPELCHASDFAAVNCHAYFDPNTEASQAGAFVSQQVQKVAQACGGKTTVVTESGWPKQGNANGKAIPSPENQQAAMASIKQHVSSNIYHYTVIDGLWKPQTACKCEPYWGLYA